MLKIISLLVEALPFKAISNFFRDDAHNIVSAKGWQTLEELTNKTNKMKKQINKDRGPQI